MRDDHATDAPSTDDTPRRRFLKQTSALLAAGIAIGFRMPDAAAAGKRASGDPHPSAGEFEPNAWVRVLPDDTIKLVVHKHDSGTGTRTALAAVVAEELDVDPFRVDVITPEDPFFADYIHPLWKVFSTGGSTSVAMEYERLRRAGATARAMLVAAAARQWSVPASTCTTADGAVLHAASGRRATYGSLAQAAAQLPAPTQVALKDPAQFRYIGKLRSKRGAAQKADGSFPYSIDVSLPGMRVAVVTRAPVIDGRVRRVDAKAALAIPGVREVLQIPPRPDVLGGNQAGVAVLADDYWSAHKGQAALTIEWEDSLFETFDSGTLAARQAAWIDDPTARVVPTIADGDPAHAKAPDARMIEASYSMPHKAANPLEPINLTVWARDGGIEYWGGLQVPSTAMEAADVIGGIPAHRVTLHELVSGGSFGAREAKYWLFEATWLAVKTGKPVKLMNSREDEMRALFYHAASHHRARAVLDAQGNLASLWLRGVMPASPQQWEPGYLERTDRMDFSTTEALTKWEFAYRAPHRDIGWIRMETGVPTGWFRAVSYIPNVFAVESVMDEAAHAAKRDPVEFRLAHMHDRPRHAAVLREAARRAGWGAAAAGRRRARRGDEPGVRQLCRGGRAGRAPGRRGEGGEAHMRGRLRDRGVAVGRRRATVRRADVGARPCNRRSHRFQARPRAAVEFRYVSRDADARHARHRHPCRAGRSGEAGRGGGTVEPRGDACDRECGVQADGHAVAGDAVRFVGVDIARERQSRRRAACAAGIVSHDQALRTGHAVPGPG